MIDKPIIVNITRNIDEDIIQVVGENGEPQTQIGLNKYVPQNRLSTTFKDLIDYVTEKTGDEYNQPFCPAQELIANDVKQMIHGTNAVDIQPKRGGRTDLQYKINLEDRVLDHFERIVESKQVQIDGRVEQYKSIELVVNSVLGGGYRIK